MSAEGVDEALLHEEVGQHGDRDHLRDGGHLEAAAQAVQILAGVRDLQVVVARGRRQDDLILLQ